MHKLLSPQINPGDRYGFECNVSYMRSGSIRHVHTTDLFIDTASLGNLQTSIEELTVWQIAPGTIQLTRRAAIELHKYTKWELERLIWESWNICGWDANLNLELRGDFAWVVPTMLAESSTAPTEIQEIFEKIYARAFYMTSQPYTEPSWRLDAIISEYCHYRLKEIIG